MGGANRGGAQSLKCEIAVGDGIERIAHGSAEAELLRSLRAIDRK